MLSSTSEHFFFLLLFILFTILKLLHSPEVIFGHCRLSFFFFKRCHDPTLIPQDKLSDVWVRSFHEKKLRHFFFLFAPFITKYFQGDRTSNVFERWELLAVSNIIICLYVCVFVHNHTNLSAFKIRRPISYFGIKVIFRHAHVYGSVDALEILYVIKYKLACLPLIRITMFWLRTFQVFQALFLIDWRWAFMWSQFDCNTYPYHVISFYCMLIIKSNR